MKKLNDLKAERLQYISRMEVITNGEMTDELRTEWDGLSTKVEGVSKDIERLEKQEVLNKRDAVIAPEETREETSLGVQFRDFLKEAIEGKGPLSFRADPIITTSDTAMINKTVANGIDVLTSPGEAFLRELGVTFYEGLNGNFIVPSMAEDLATFPGEDASAVSADMLPASLTLAARRLTHTQSITRETLAQTNPGIYASIVQNLVDGLGNALVKDVMATVISDAATQVKVTSTTATNADVVNMEASLGGLSIGAAKYVTTPSGKALFKRTIALGTTAGPGIWTSDNTMNGYAAFGCPQLAASRTVFGDWSKEVVGKWGNYEVIVDPYSNAKQGRINLTIVALVDTGNANKRAFAILDASLA